jgi:hypothetical protein
MNTYKVGDRVLITATGQCYTVRYASEDNQYCHLSTGNGQSVFWISELEPAPEVNGDPTESEFILVCTEGAEIPVFNSEHWNRDTVRAVIQHNEKSAA